MRFKLETVDYELLRQQITSLTEGLSCLKDLDELANLASILSLLEAIYDAENPPKPTPNHSVRIHILEWFDEENGNSYWAAQVWVDKNNPCISFKFNYGYENHGFDVVMRHVREFVLTDVPSSQDSHHKWAQENQVEVNVLKEAARTEEDTKRFGKGAPYMG